MKLPWWVNTILAGVLAVASVLLLAWGVQRHPIREVVLPVAVGALLLAAALVFAWWVLLALDPPLLWTAAILLGTGAAMTVFASIRFIAWLAPLGLFVLILGLLAVYEHLAHQSYKAPVWFLLLGIALLVVAPAIIAMKPLQNTVAGLLLAIAGLVLMKLGVTAYVLSVEDGLSDEVWQAQMTSRSLWMVTRGALIAGVGFAFLLMSPTVGNADLHPLIEIAGAVFVIAGLSAVGLAAFQIKPAIPGDAATWSWWIVAASGALVAAASAAWVVWGVLPVWEALALTTVAVAVLIGAFFIFRGEGIVMLVLFGFVLTWVIVDRTEEPVRVDGAGVIVALGDSFISGQGANEYLDGTNTQSADQNSCRRSPGAYVYLVGAHLNREVRNYGCNGAKTKHIDLEPQGPAEQLQQMKADGVDDIDLVLVSIGGNDAQFSSIVTACVLPSDCTEVSERFEALVDLIETNLIRTYDAIRAEVGPSVPIVAIPYPDYIAGDCELSLTPDEADFASPFVARINDMIFKVVDGPNGSGVMYFPDIDKAYEGHRLCNADEAGANFIRLVPQEGNIFQRLNPLSWYDATMHPNEFGHECTAIVLRDWLVGTNGPLELVEAASIAPPLDCVIAANAEATPVNPFVPGVGFGFDNEGVPCVLADPEDPSGGCFDEDGWIADQLEDTVQKLAAPFVMLVLGGMLLALGLARVFVAKWSMPFLPAPPQAPSVMMFTRVDWRKKPSRYPEPASGSAQDS